MLAIEKLTDDQVIGAHFLASRPCAMLADAPGVGKTAQLVHAFDVAGARRGCIVCPPILRENISREFETWGLFGEPVHIIRSGKDEIPRNGIIAVSYNLASNPDIQKKLLKRGGELLACDEAHALKEPGAKRTKALLSAKGIARGYDRMAWLTGTPAPNNASEFYTFAKAAGVWHGNQSAFISEFCTTIHTPFGDKITGNRNPEGLKALLAPVMLRRTVIEGLPPLRLATLPVEGDTRALNNAMDIETRQAIEAAAAAEDFSFLETPFIATIRRLAGIAKAASVAEMAKHELENGEPKIVLFAYHKDVIATLAAALSEYNPGILDGATPEKQRQRRIDDFQQGGVSRVIICQTQSASEGLTFTAAKRIIIAEPSWTPKDNEQMIRRVYRRGQKHPVRASMATLAGSIDDQIVRANERKIKSLSEIF